MNFYGLIPARGGSKRLPGKNIRSFAGKPLIAHSCEVALAADCLSGIYVSTDDRDVARIAEEAGAIIPYMRDTTLAEDATPMAPVVADFLGWLERSGKPVDAIVLLQPTSPLRRARHIEEACALFQKTNVDTVVSVTDVPHQFHPLKVMGWRDGNLEPYLEDAPLTAQTGQLPQAFGRNGPAVLISSANVVRNGLLYGKSVQPYIMPANESVDIDTLEDFHLAEHFFNVRVCE